MDREFWQDSWAAGRTTFHEGRPNAYLERHGARLGGARRILVPLCGKAEDLAYLAGLGHEVIGVELVEDAVRAFFLEHGVTPVVCARGAVTEYAAGAITILAGDLFATSPELIGAVDGLYDRAALIALPLAMRAPYVAHLRRLLPAAAPGLIITVEYPQGSMEGPPFSVSEVELRSYWAGAALQLLGERAAGGTRLAGIAGARERCFLLGSPA